MDKLFQSIFQNETTSVGHFFLIMLISLVSGTIFSCMCHYKTKSSKSFFITIAMLPTIVAMIIMLVNGNVGTGVAVAGAFSLVRFRSASGTAKEICIIFITMAAGLAFGMGYIAYGALFIIISGIILMLFSKIKIWENKVEIKEKRLRITIPEGLDYNTVFDDLMKKYTDKYDLVKVKSINMGSMFRITYLVTMKDCLLEKQFLDELRCRNGNLEILVERTDLEITEL